MSGPRFDSNANVPAARACAVLAAQYLRGAFLGLELFTRHGRTSELVKPRL